MISIISPVYNTAPYLKQCIESVIIQSVTDWELIIVDDGSSDGSQEIIKEYCNKDTRISFYQSNSGCVSIARNLGIEHSTGDWILFLDSDDYLLPDCLQNFLNATSEYPEADVIQASFMVENMRTNRITKSFRADRRRPFAGKVRNGDSFISDHGWFVGVAWNTLIRASYLKENHILFPPDVAVQEDLVFIIELALHDGNFLYIDVDTFVYRWGRPNSLTSKTNGKNINRIKRVTQYYSSLLNVAIYLQKVKSEFSPLAQNLLNEHLFHNSLAILQGNYEREYCTQGERANLQRKLIQSISKLPKIGGAYNIITYAYNLSPCLLTKILNIFC